MIFQKRDAQVLQWINSFGFATAEQIQKFMKIKKTTAYVRIKKLVDGGYLTRERLLHGEGRLHKVTKLGVLASTDGLAPMKYITLGTFRHDLMLVDLALALEAETGGTFIPDRRFRHNEGLSGKGQLGRVADGYLFIGDDKPIAIELELSVKSRARIADVIKTYGGDLGVKEVWYYTDQKSVVHALQKAAKGYSFIKIRQLPEKLAA